VRPALAALALLTACGGGDRSAPAPARVAPPAASTAPATFTFDWSPPCAVPVVERRHQKGHDTVVRYRLELRPLRDGELAVDHVGFVALSVDGIDLSGPQHAREAAEFTKLAALYPSIVIDLEGNYLRAEGMLELLEQILMSEPPEKRDEMREYMTAPGVLEPMAQKYAEPWLVAVSMWSGMTLAPGKSLVAYDGTIEHLGMDDGLAHLRYTSRLEGAALAAFMESTLRSMFDEIMARSPDAPFDFEDFIAKLDGFREATIEVITDPATLRPRRSKSEVRGELRFGEEPTPLPSERHELEFDWERAVGCGK
jgi:hypothetical protein